MDNNYNNFDPFGTQNQDNYENTTAPEQNTSENTPPNTYSPQSGYYYPPKPIKTKKEKKKYSSASLIACCLICALIASFASSSVVYYIAKENSNTSGGGSTTTINVDKNSSNTVAAIAQKAVPSVVGITATTSVNTFFGFSTDAQSEGSGVIYSQDGYIITNYHVISSAVENNRQSGGNISVYLSSDPDTAIPAKVVGYNSDYDLAVLKIEKTGLTPIEFADSNDVAVGDMAVAIGNPGGQQFMSSVSSGIISGLDRTIQLEGTAQMKLLQTDAAINPGNSGGALVDCYGRLVGINSSKISSEEYEGMGFAIPANTVKKQVSNIINNKDKKYAYVGVKISTDYTADALTDMGYPAGAVVESVTEGSPAAKIGIKSADIIVNFGGVEIKDYDDYNTERLKHKPGETVNITIYRNGKNYDAQITLGESNN
ncbi:MAG: S1C family serine protease [Acutalibacteraceae bacterium]